MRKIHDLLMEAAVIRMNDFDIDYDKCYEWAKKQTVEDLLNYISNNRVSNRFINLDKVIWYYETHDYLDEYESKALKYLKDYKKLKEKLKNGTNKM